MPELPNAKAEGPKGSLKGKDPAESKLLLMVP